jgi:hypothetical protein
MFSKIEKSNLQSINPCKLKSVELMSNKQTVIDSLKLNKSIESMSQSTTENSDTETFDSDSITEFDNWRKNG